MDLIKINGNGYLVTIYKPGYAQIWKPGTGRDSNDGKWYGSILGYYTNIKATVYFENENEVQQFIKDTRKSNIVVEFYDPEIKGINTRNFYISNFEINVRGFYDEGADVYFDTTDIELIAKEGN